MKTDALGNPLIIGQTYGYSRSDNGVTTVRIGKLIRVTEKQVSLEVTESKRALYSNDLEKSSLTNFVISVKANGLFPVYTELLTKLKRLSNTETINDAGEMQDCLEEISELLETQTPHIKL